jgi:glycosyltransferase involved in cell wall biosynthesis
MTPARADTLILLMPPGATLRGWASCGSLVREAAFAAAMLAHYQRVAIISFGDSSERATLDQSLPEDARARVQLVANDDGLDEDAYLAHLPTKVQAACADARRVLVRTHQLECGQFAVKLCHGLVQRGMQVALLARGEYLWTRRLASEVGGESSKAQEAGREEGALCWAADLIVGGNDAMIRDLAWRYGLHASRTRVVPTLVLGPAALDESAPVEREPGLIVHVGPLAARHKVDTILRAVAHVRESIAQAHLEVWGDGPERENLERLARELNLDVKFHRDASHALVLPRLGACQVFAHASDAEDHLLGVLQAMACGAPVVAADSPAIARLVQHGVTGLRVEGSPESFSVAFQGMLADADWHDMLGTNARRVAQEQFGLERVVKAELETHGAACGFAFSPHPASKPTPQAA